jgi:hypothetical protein
MTQGIGGYRNAQSKDVPVAERASGPRAMTAFRKGLTLVVLAALPGCASVNFVPRVDSVGEYKNTTGTSERADDMRSSEAADVRVLVGTLPEGVRIEHDGLVVDPARYALVGRVSADYKPYGFTWLGFWFYDYSEDERWKNAYCGVQVPLTWVTLGIWPFVSPFHYPCKVVAGGSPSEVGERKARVIKTLQKATKAAGGDLLIVTGLGDLDLVAAGSGQLLGAIPMMHGSGFALRTRRAP